MNAGMPNPNSGMIEVRKQSEILESEAAQKRKVVPVHRICRSLHLIAAEPSILGRYFINNYIELEIYNLVYLNLQEISVGIMVRVGINVSRN
jgi:hypothetical protein